MEAVVVVRADLRPGFMVCSGVAIAPRLVATALACVVRPADMSDPDPASVDPGVEDLHLPGIDYTQTCAADSWAAREDGSFSGQLGKSVDLVVYRQDDGREVAVTDISTSRAVSRCADGLALLTLERDLVVPRVNIRLDEVTRPAEPVRLRGHCLGPTGLTRTHSLDSQVEGLNPDLGTAQAPPRALWMREAVPAYDFGGAVLSNPGGELIGILVSGSSLGCDSADPTGGSIALRLAPFRRMLLDTARPLGVTLRSESAFLGVTQLPTCPD